MRNNFDVRALLPFMRTILFLGLFQCISLLARADDWPQWLGPQRDGVWRETGIVEKFPDGRPEGALARRRSAAATAGPPWPTGSVYVMDRQLADGREIPATPSSAAQFRGKRTRALPRTKPTAKILWKHEYDCPYDVSYAAGPRVTPTGRRRQSLYPRREGDLFCLDATSGNGPLVARLQEGLSRAQDADLGLCRSSALDGNKLICLVGGDGSVAVAFDKDTGKELWRALSAQGAGLLPAHDDHKPAASGSSSSGIPRRSTALDPETGKVYLVASAARSAPACTIPTPRQSGDLLFLTSFYNGSTCFRSTASQPDATSRGRGKVSETNTDTLHSLMATPLIEDGYIYGVVQLRPVALPEAGDRRARSGKPSKPTGALAKSATNRWGNAFLIKHGDRFFLFNEKGDLIIAKLSPKGYEEISRAHLLDPTNRDPRPLVVWSHPAFANKCVYARNDKEIVCVSLAAK